MKRLLLISIILVGIHSHNTAQSINILPEILNKQTEYALTLCKHLHQNPEVSFMETETSARMIEEMEKIGFEVTPEFGGNNVVGVFKNGDGPVVMLRTDMDALPMKEKTGLPFASTKTMKDADGKEVPAMHACGHDIHMSVFIGSLRTLVALKEQWSGTLLVIAQQAEEKSGGSGLAIEQGLYQKFPVPDYAMAYHINPELEAGKIGLSAGPVFAGVKTVEITVHGKGSHGAYPEKSIDPVVIASRTVLDLQTIVSREISPLEPVVVTVGSIHGGSAPNIIPDQVKLQLTLRYYNEETIQQVIQAIKRISRGAALTAGIPEDKLPDVWVDPNPTPPVINDEEMAAKLNKFLGQSLGKSNIVKKEPAMVGEDFGKYGLTPENVPICLMWLGSTNPERMKELKSRGEKPAPLHSPELLPDYDKTIYTGIKGMVSNVMGLCGKGGE